MSQTPTERLIAWMQRQGLKQVDLARRMDLSESAISLILNGHREPTHSFAGRFFHTFGPEAAVEVFGMPSQPVEATA